MGYVFVSYSRSDEQIARHLRAQLLERGISAWMDVFDITPGKRWPDEIDRALRNADAILGVLTENALDSVNVKNEWDWAIANDRRLLLTRFEPCALPFHYVSLNYIDFTNEFDRAFEQLTNALGQQPANAATSDSETSTHAGSTSASPRPGSPENTGRSNLPVLVQPILGRDADVDGVASLLSTSRIITITGPGGIGKTRLSLEVAQRVASSFSGDSYFVSLTSLDRPEQVASWIARELGIQENPDLSQIRSISTHIGDSDTFLLLDNFEHLLPAAELVSQLVKECSRLKILVTSRTPLNLSGEQEYPLRPLAEQDAAHLFIKRAREINPAFEPGDDERSMIGEICRRLDGLPLAIELAASRTRLLPTKQLLARLARPLSVLTGGPRDLARHQQTLRDTIAWSFDLLSADDQKLFCMLGVFAGDWSLDAAEAIAGDELDVLEGLTRLAESSLIERGDEGEYEPRFRMLETIREFAHERLAERDDVDSLRKRHADFFLDLVNAALTHLYGAEQVAWLDRLEREHANLRAALDWLSDHDIDAGLKLVAPLWRLWWTRGYLDTGRYYYDLMLERAESANPEPDSLALALTGAGIVAEWQREHALATELQHRAIKIWNSLQQPDDEAFWSFVSLGNMALIVGRINDAERIYGEGLAFAERHRLANGKLVMMDNLGLVALKQGRYETAEHAFREVIGISEKHGYVWYLELACAQLGTLLLQQLRRSEAREHFERSISLSKHLGNMHDVAASMAHLGHVELDEGNLQRAELLYQQSIQHSNEIDDPTWFGEAYLGLAFLSMQRGDLATSREHLAEALRFGLDLSDPDISVRVIEGFARWHLEADQPDRGAMILAFASNFREQRGVPVSPHWQREIDAIDRDLHKLLTVDERSRFVESVESMTLEQFKLLLNSERT